MLRKTCNLLEKAETFLGAAAILLFFLCTAWQVISRLIGVPAAFTEEIANTSFAWATFMGAAVLLRHNEHFNFSAFSVKLKGKAFLVNESIILLLLLGFSVLIAVHGTQLTMQFATWRFTSLPKVSRAWGWMCMPVFGYTSILYCIENIIKFIKDPSSRKIHDELEEIESEVA